MKKYKILIISFLALIILAGVWQVKTNLNNAAKEKEKLAFSTGFILLDDEKDLVWSEAVKLSDEARAQYENKIIEIKANLIQAGDKETRLADFNNLALYANYLGNYRQAYDAYIESLKLEDRARISWQNFADVLFKIKAYKSAEFAYKKAIDLNKYIPESYVKLANYYKTMGDSKNIEATYKLAIETIKQSLESDTLILSDYADWLADEKRYDEAIKVYQELEAKQPNNKAAIERKIEQLRSKK